MNTEDRFNEYHANNPIVYTKLVELARVVKSRGRKQYGIAALYERLRWHFQFEADTVEEYKMCNDFKPDYARMIMKQEPDLAGFFKTKHLFGKNRG